MAPTQIKILPFGPEQMDYARAVKAKLDNVGMRVEIDGRNETIGYKIRAAQLDKTPYMLIIGDKEMQDGTVAVRSRKAGDLGAIPVDQFVADAVMEVAEKRR